ncbi:T9SS type A sorting domain-containing protein [Flavobacterium wongokense]|uniref:T9SS type A sorting domain-containing protein n=1 Tax=Flavobacterium wongokense TaxID=2910674 RepID=UPI001F45CEE9|nr:T9SS type A sorting domain-containing protein [Flavobacterium sp. WG47]MCF6131039.1 T9SS type A sorting domain-containing protein [Flavobacterium sp. WG47]
MKIKLLLLLLITTAISFAQNQINSFYGTSGFISSAVTSANPINHGAGGTAQNWTFSGLTPYGNTTYTYVAPTANESSTYPGTTSVIVSSSTQGSTTTEGRMFTKAAGATISITGLSASGLTINLNGGTNGSGNATLGAFPMVYPFTNTDSSLSGTYNYTTYSGTFSGNMTTTVDGYGVLNLPQYGYTGNVTRLKTVLTISLNYLFLTDIGTITQTSYSYYAPSDTSNNFKFRSVNTTAVVDLAGINQNDTTLEVGFAAILGTSTNALQSVWIKNPVENTIEINTPTAIENAKINITDMLGKTIYQSQNNSIDGTFELPISLTKGIYLITIGNDNGSITKKIVKS